MAEFSCSFQTRLGRCSHRRNRNRGPQPPQQQPQPPQQGRLFSQFMAVLVLLSLAVLLTVVNTNVASLSSSSLFPLAVGDVDPRHHHPYPSSSGTTTTMTATTAAALPMMDPADQPHQEPQRQQQRSVVVVVAIDDSVSSSSSSVVYYSTKAMVNDATSTTTSTATTTAMATATKKVNPDETIATLPFPRGVVPLSNESNNIDNNVVWDETRVESDGTGIGGENDNIEEQRDDNDDVESSNTTTGDGGGVFVVPVVTGDTSLRGTATTTNTTATSQTTTITAATSTSSRSTPQDTLPSILLNPSPPRQSSPLPPTQLQQEQRQGTQQQNTMQGGGTPKPKTMTKPKAITKGQGPPQNAMSGGGTPKQKTITKGGARTQNAPTVVRNIYRSNYNTKTRTTIESSSRQGATTTTTSNSHSPDTTTTGNNNFNSEIARDTTVHTVDSMTTPIPTVIDILSIGSQTRTAYQDAQERTFRTHDSVRQFLRITEWNDTDATCYTNFTMDQLHQVMDFCRVHDTNVAINPAQQQQNLSFVSAELRRKLFVGRNSTGWMCAQKRPIDGLYLALQNYQTNLQQQQPPPSSPSSLSIPDYLFIIDDDTYLNMPAVVQTLQQHHPADEPHIVAGCQFAVPRTIHFFFPYGGFGTMLTRQAVHNLLQPIDCSNLNNTTHNPLVNGSATPDAFAQLACWRLQQNLVGERSFFRDGMSVADLMYAYASGSALTRVHEWSHHHHNNVGYCFHSDHTLGYFMGFYHIAVPDDMLLAAAAEMTHDGNHHNNNNRTELLRLKYGYGGIHGIERGECRNERDQCRAASRICHYIEPEQMDQLFVAQQQMSPKHYVK